MGHPLPWWGRRALGQEHLASCCGGPGVLVGADSQAGVYCRKGREGGGGRKRTALPDLGSEPHDRGFCVIRLYTLEALKQQEMRGLKGVCTGLRERRRILLGKQLGVPESQSPQVPGQLITAVHIIPGESGPCPQPQQSDCLERSSSAALTKPL